MDDDLNAGDDLNARLRQATDQLKQTEQQLSIAEERRRQAGERQQDCREQCAQALLTANKHKTEMDMLKNLLTLADSEQFPPIIDQIVVKKGYELRWGPHLAMI